MIAEFQYLRIADCTRFLESFNTATDIPALITITEKTLEEILPFEYSGLYLFDEQSQQLKLFVARGLSKKEQEVAESTAMQRHPGSVFKTGKSIYVPDVTQDKNNITTDSPRSFTVRTRLYLPIRSNGKVIGTFGVVSAKPYAFNQAEQELFEFICTLAGSVHFRIITENKRKIYEAESNKLSAIVKYTDNAVVVTDPDGKIEWINESFTKMTGYTLEECLGKIPGHFLQGSSSNHEVREKIRQALVRKEKIDITIVNYTKQGRPYDVFLQISPIFDEKGKHTHYVAIQRDVTFEVEAKKKLQEQKSKLSAIIDTLPDRLFTIDKAGNFRELTEKTYVETDPREANIPLRNIKDHLTEDQYQIQIKNVENTLAGIPCAPFLYETNRTGEKKFFETRMAKLDHQNTLAIVREITAQKLNELEKTRQANFNNIIAEMSVKMIDADPEEIHGLISHFISQLGSFFQSDSGFVYQLSKDGNEAINTHHFILDKNGQSHQGSEFTLSPETLESVLLSVKKNKPVIIQSRVTYKEHHTDQPSTVDSIVDVSIIALPIVVGKGIAGFYGFAANATRKVWTNNDQTLLMLSNEIISNAYSRLEWESKKNTFSKVFENASFGAIFVDKTNKINYVNRFASKTLCISESKLLMNTLFSDLFADPKLEKKFGFNAIKNSGVKRLFELEVVTGKKEKLTLLANAVAIHEHNQDETLVSYTFTDITERKAQEQETRQALDLVNEQNKRLLNFSYIVSHNIRSHASNILGISRILAEDPNEEMNAQFLNALVKSSENLDVTLRHLNELLNIQSKLKIKKENILLKEVIHRTREILSEDISKTNCIIHTDISEDLHIYSDKAYLDSILLNLITNAIKYRKKDHPPVIHITAKAEGENTVLRVEDNGSGIDLKKHGHQLFGMFKTFHGNREARGIGLFLIKNQIEAMGGSIAVLSAPGEGTTFTIELPIP